MRRIEERLDEVSRKATNTLSASESRAAMTNISTASLAEQVAVLSGRVDTLLSKVRVANVCSSAITTGVYVIARLLVF